jgi:hypothetical protein
MAAQYTLYWHKYGEGSTSTILVMTVLTEGNSAHLLMSDDYSISYTAFSNCTSSTANTVKSTIRYIYLRLEECR